MSCHALSLPQIQSFLAVVMISPDDADCAPFTHAPLPQHSTKRSPLRSWAPRPRSVPHRYSRAPALATGPWSAYSTPFFTAITLRTAMRREAPPA